MFSYFERVSSMEFGMWTLQDNQNLHRIVIYTHILLNLMQFTSTTQTFSFCRFEITVLGSCRSPSPILAWSRWRWGKWCDLYWRSKLCNMNWWGIFCDLYYRQTLWTELLRRNVGSELTRHFLCVIWWST